MSFYARYPAITVSADPNAATSANQVLQIAQETAIAGSTASIDSKTPTVGQKTMAASSPVVIASDQSAVPISAASLPLPTGAATAANQATEITSLGSIDTKTPALVAGKVPVNISTTSGAALTAAAVAGALDVYINNPSVPVKGNGVSGTAVTANTLLISGDNGGTQRNVAVDASGNIGIQATALPLPTGAATAAKQPALGTAGSASTDVITVQGIANGTNLNMARPNLYVTGTVTAGGGIQSVSIDCSSGISTVVVNTTSVGAYVGSIAFEASVDGITFFGVSGTDLFLLDGQLPTQVFYTSGGGLFTFNTSGYKTFRLRGSITGNDVSIRMGGSQAVSQLSQIQSTTFVSLSGTVTTREAVNTNGSIVNTALVATTAATVTKPANAIGFVLEAPSTNTDNIRWCVGGTASTTVGMLTEPGRDTGYLPISANISVCSTVSGTNAFSIQWILSS